MAPESFVVGCGSISVYGGVVILDLMGLSPTERDAQGQPLKEMTQRVIMTPQAALETFNAMQGLMNVLEQRGLVKRTDASGAPADPADTQASPGGDRKPRSRSGQPRTPNF